MIIDLQKFIKVEKKYWTELEGILDKLENEPEFKMTLDQSKRFHYLYQRVSADLTKIMTFASEPEMHRYLESLTARAYGEIHEIREKPHRITPFKWFFGTLPRTFRKHRNAFLLSVSITLAGFLFGAFAVSFDPEAKDVIMPFSQLQINPSERVKLEEEMKEDRLKGIKMSGAAWYMTHNTQVSITVMALGVTWGVGTVILLFYNGVLLGAVSLDYILAGESKFLTAWLSPHGVTEIPAILLAGQAGLVLSGALIGWGNRVPLIKRLREISKDLVTLIAGVSLLLVWSGFIEAFVSQYHKPFLPYWLKISFAAIELVCLILFLSICGRKEIE